MGGFISVAFSPLAYHLYFSRHFSSVRSPIAPAIFSIFLLFSEPSTKAGMPSSMAGCRHGIVSTVIERHTGPPLSCLGRIEVVGLSGSMPKKVAKNSPHQWVFIVWGRLPQIGGVRFRLTFCRAQCTWPPLHHCLRGHQMIMRSGRG